VPAAAVIPAPIAYAKIAVVEKLVVGFRRKKDGMRIWKQSTRLSLEISLCREKFSMRIIFAQGLFTPFS